MSFIARRRTRSLLAAASVLAVAAVAPATASATPTTAAKAASDFLVGQLQGSPTPNHFVTTYSFGGTTGSYDDTGSTLDGFFAFKAAAATGTSYETYAVRTLDYAKANLNGYVGSGTTTAATCATTGTLYAGALGKVALANLAQNRNPTVPATTGGRDLIADLRCRENTAGRFVDTPTDYSVTFSQALGILALKRHYGTGTYTNPNGTTLTTAVNYLKGQQCSSGAFPSSLGGGASGCTASNPGDVDSTAYAVLALQQTGQTAAATSALNWLHAQRQTPASGQTAWSASVACDGQAAPALSVNSTALAVVANSSGTAVTPVAPAKAWLEAQARSNGALKGCPSSIGAVQTSNDVRASTQGVLGLLGAGFP